MKMFRVKNKEDKKINKSKIKVYYISMLIPMSIVFIFILYTSFTMTYETSVKSIVGVIFEHTGQSNFIFWKLAFISLSLLVSIGTIYGIWKEMNNKLIG